jgi:hypothetical protein
MVSDSMFVDGVINDETMTSLTGFPMMILPYLFIHAKLKFLPSTQILFKDQSNILVIFGFMTPCCTFCIAIFDLTIWYVNLLLVDDDLY